MIYFGIALFCTALFVVQFVLSMIFGDMMDADIDFDGDGSVDLDLSGIFSFKGLLHFGIGFSWSMWFARGQENQFLAALISIGIGILTSILLAIAYWLTLKLKKEITPERGQDLVGREAEIYYSDDKSKEWIVFLEINGSLRKIPTTSDSGKTYSSGQKTEIIKYEEGKYWIP